MTDKWLDYTNKYLLASVNPGHEKELERIKAVAITNKDRYQNIAEATGMPWFGVAAIHSLEASQNFKTYLQNGDPLWNSDGNPIKTVHVPKGVGPYPNWEAAAIAAIGKVHIHSIGELLRWCEAYNGLGYQRHGVPSPYIWSYTNMYKRGKYVADNEFDPAFVSTQPGVAAILKVLGVSSVDTIS